MRRYAPNLGAVVTGLSLSAPLSAEVKLSLRRALLQHGVLFFREQELSAQHLLEVGNIFGEPLRHNPYLPSTEETSGVEVIESGVGKRSANESWHADVTWRPNPPSATLLYARELPPSGGDTIWTSSTAAYRSLDPLLRAYLETLTAVNYVDANGYSRQTGADPLLDELRTAFPPIDVELIKQHPVTGEKYVFANELHTLYIKGVTRDVSDSLLRLLFATLQNPLFHARFSWQPGSLAIWDNRLVQHRAIQDYGDQRRVLLRITLA